MFISVICVQEARIGEHSNVEHLNLNNYTIITQAYTDRCSRKGGLVTYLLNSIPLANQMMHNTYSTWEGLFVDTIDDSGKKITIYIIIRHCPGVGAFPRPFCVLNSVALASLTLQVGDWAIH